jgi:hypothetical protein
MFEPKFHTVPITIKTIPTMVKDNRKRRSDIKVIFLTMGTLAETPEPIDWNALTPID